LLRSEAHGEGVATDMMLAKLSDQELRKRRLPTWRLTEMCARGA
jgi:hypothetical protein